MSLLLNQRQRLDIAQTMGRWFHSACQVCSRFASAQPTKSAWHSCLVCLLIASRQLADKGGSRYPG